MQHWDHLKAEMTCTQAGEDESQYGIRITDELTGKTVYEESEISEDRSFVESILACLKEEEVEPVHIADVVEDLVSAQTLVFACIRE